MATISRELAEKMIRECKAGKRSTYCIVRYQDGSTLGYAYCNSEAEFQGIMRSFPRGNVEILWESPRFKDPKKRQHALAKDKRMQEFRDYLGL